MKKELILQGRSVLPEDIDLIKRLLHENPAWCRTHLSKELCRIWQWSTPSGQLKDIACRSLLRKLAESGHICLPQPLTKPRSRGAMPTVTPVLHVKTPITEELKQLFPIELRVVEKGYDLNLFKSLISTYHYLGWSGTVGENLKYLVLDKMERPLGCIMFGAAAWKVAPRDQFIGWDVAIRQKNLERIVNNNRFLILPWVSVKNLASYILGSVCRRINADFMGKYNHPVYLLESFVEKDKFYGTCYKAANWLNVGDTQGRGKLDIKNEYKLPVKSIWLYPLIEAFREKLKG